MAAPHTKTTVVGSYPFPDWLGALPSEQAVIDATRVVIHTQEQAGIDLVCDGELYRFDVNHPETNGMIEYFVKPMAGVRSGVTFDELVAYRAQRATKFRTRRPAVVEAPIGPGTLDLPQACARAKRLADRPFKFTLTGPHMLAKMPYDVHYRDLPKLTMAIADALAAQVAHRNADVIQADEANLPGSPDEWPWAAEAMNRVLDAVKTAPAVHLCFGNYGGQFDPAGHVGQADRLSQCAACRSHRDGNSPPAAAGVGRVSRVAARDQFRARGRGYQVDRDQDRG
jgi:5-methyltetrahydropteroyltriglutamate--homocysteine methyltransferase